MSSHNPFAVVMLETFAVDRFTFDAEIAQASGVSDFIEISAGVSVATGHRAGGDPVVFVRSAVQNGLHAIVCPDPDAQSDPRVGLVT